MLGYGIDPAKLCIFSPQYFHRLYHQTSFLQKEMEAGYTALCVVVYAIISS